MAKTTADGYEIHFGVNYLAHFLLTKLSMDYLEKENDSRIVIVSSSLLKKGRITENYAYKVINYLIN